MIGRAREVRSGKDPQPPLVLMEGGLVKLGDLLRRLALGESGRDDLVLTAIHRILTHVSDIGHVLHRRHGVPEEGQRASQPVSKQVRAQVAEVDWPVHGGPAGVHADLAGPLGGERNDVALERVEDVKLHGLPLAKGYVLVRVLP